ncbi:EARLY FLOWERING 4-like [Olea europaea subsp. europaea]|uniref:EARLY FLOWERING 4-like n=1 Tax=Olea europaea subsp. europaea TaxID=158383 RepID=A0A8S0RL04_OLEEU|nr:EARLY FLOWERING 4-like [Olea europaea subsp. europaea]
MDDDFQIEAAANRPNHRYNGSGGENEDGKGEASGDVEAWEILSKAFNEVQTVLNQNRVLIQQVNENHQSKTPDNLAKNVDLIKEINGNISKVLGLYSNMSTNFSSVIRQQPVIASGDGKSITLENYGNKALEDVKS